jgi:hypothetical protein
VKGPNYHFDFFTAEPIFDAIGTERARQDALRDAGKFPWTLADDHVQTRPWEGVVPLGEEFGEVCRALCEHDTVALRAELIQLAACCVAWVEGIDRTSAREAARQYQEEGEALLEDCPPWSPSPTSADYNHGPQGAD